MKILGEHNRFQFEEFSGDGYLYASATEKGVQLQVRGYSPTRSGYVNFGFAPEEGAQLSVVAEGLLPLVPTLEQARSMHAGREADVAEFWRKEYPGEPLPEPKPFVAQSPVVHTIEFDEGSDKSAEFKGGLLEPDELVVVGGLTWAREQLILRFDEVDTLTFRPDAFGELALIAATQPSFPPKTSIWDRTSR